LAGLLPARAREGSAKQLPPPLERLAGAQEYVHGRRSLQPAARVRMRRLGAVSDSTPLLVTSWTGSTRRQHHFLFFGSHSSDARVKKEERRRKEIQIAFSVSARKNEEYNQLAEKYWESMSIRVHIHALFSLIDEVVARPAAATIVGLIVGKERARVPARFQLKFGLRQVAGDGRYLSM